MPRRPQLFPRNDNVVFLRGLVDAVDPKNADGSPKWINSATVTWEVRTAEYPGGSIVSSGNAVAEGTGGAYRIELASAISILAESDYHLHVAADAGAYHADWDDSFEALTRTGRTAVT